MGRQEDTCQGVEERKILKKRSNKHSSSPDCDSSANRKPDANKKKNKKKLFWDREKFRCSSDIYFVEKDEQVNQRNFVEQIERIEQLECIDQVEYVEQIECLDHVELFQVEYNELVKCVDPESIKFEFECAEFIFILVALMAVGVELLALKGYIDKCVQWKTNAKEFFIVVFGWVMWAFKGYICALDKWKTNAKKSKKVKREYTISRTKPK